MKNQNRFCGAEELGEWVSGSLRLADVGEQRCQIHSDPIKSIHPVRDRFYGFACVTFHCKQPLLP